MRHAGYSKKGAPMKTGEEDRLHAASGIVGNTVPNRPPVRYRDLFATFFKIGLFTFGGGYAMIPLIHREMVEKKAWIDDEEIVDVLALAQMVPGAVAINAATLIGKRLAGNRGGLVATASVILPSFLVITVIAAFLGHFQDDPVVKAAFLGIRPAVAALMAVAVWKVGKSSIRDALGWIIALVAFAMVVFLSVHAIYAILGAAVFGIFLHYAFPGASDRLLAKSQKKGKPSTTDDKENWE
jgi:chromate transporter